MLILCKISKSFFKKIFLNDTMVVFFRCTLSSPCSGSVVGCDLVYRPPKYDQRAHLWRFCFKWFLYLKYDSPRASGMRDSNVFHISGSWWFSLLLVWVRYWTTAEGRVTLRHRYDITNVKHHLQIQYKVHFYIHSRSSCFKSTIGNSI